MIGDGGRGVFLFCLWLALAGIAPHAADATIFDDGNDRKLVNDLRARETRSEELTEIELAILEAANRVGAFSFCNSAPDKTDGISGTASLIRFHGRLAVITSAHYLVDLETRQMKCSEERAGNALFYPNMSWAGIDNEFAMMSYRLEYPPENLGNYLNTDRVLQRRGTDPLDYLVFYLQEDITQSRMPDGRIRGAFKPSSRVLDLANGPGFMGDALPDIHMLGFAPDIQDGVPMIYQESCAGIFRLVRDLLLHTCDTVGGTSGSALLSFDGEELHLAAVNNFSGVGGDDIIDGKYADPSYGDGIWNGGSPASVIFRDYPNAPYAEVPPGRLAYHLQRALKDAGCYDGALDNQWGPASRAALAAFKTQSGSWGEALVGTGPGRALLDAVWGLLLAVTCR